MSTPTKARSKRALPSVPLERTASVDRIVTGTLKSARRKVDVQLEPTGADVTKYRSRSTSQPQQTSALNMNSKLRSEPFSRRKDLSSSESGSGNSSPYNSPRETRKATVAPMVAQIIDKFNNGSQETKSEERFEVKEESFGTEKKIARVLPMTPHFLDEHTTNEQPPCTKQSDIDSIADLKITNLQSMEKVNSHGDEKLKGSFIPPGKENVLGVIQPKMAGTPSSVTQTPYQPLADEAEGSSVRVGVRVRPFLPR